MAYGITGPAQKKGLFGKQVNPLAYSTGIGDDLKVQHSAQERQMAQPMPEQKKPGFFDKGGGSQYVFAGLQDFLQRRMGEQPTGVATLLQRQQAEQQAAAQASQAQLQRAQKMADWRAQKEYEWENAPEPNNDTVRDFEWYSSLTPEQREMYHQMKPEIMIGADGRPYPVRRTPAPPDTLPPDFDFGGGSAGNGTGGFPG